MPGYHLARLLDVARSWGSLAVVTAGKIGV